MSQIHATAVVASGAKLGSDVRIGPFCVVGPEVEIGDGTVLHSHVVVEGRSRIGRQVEIFPFASIGHKPQDLKYRGEPSELFVGDKTQIREHVTINPGTAGGGLVTRVGSGCLLMVGAHVAHDCQVGDGVIMANNVTLAGHVQIGDRTVIGGMSAILQFVRVGNNAMIGGMSGVEQDVIPYGLVMGERANLVGLNLVGLRRRNDLPRDQIQGLQQAFRSLFGEGEGTLADRSQTLLAAAETNPLVRALVEFVQGESTHGICQPRDAG